MPRLRFVFSLMTFVFLAGLALAQDAGVNWNPPIIDVAKIGSPSIGAITCDPVNRKLYVGTIYCTERDKTLLVYDLAGDGTVTGKPRYYPVLTGQLEYPKRDSISCLLLDSKHHRLYAGVSSEQAMNTTISLLQLDDKGEPKGEPFPFISGNPNSAVQALALHPTLNRLYAVGWGGAGVYANDLDADGKPIGKPKGYDVGGQGKYAISIRSDGTKIYVGSYPDILEVCDVNPQGAVKAAKSIQLKIGLNSYLVFAGNDRGLYFKDKGGFLNYIKLDPQGNPIGDAVKDETLAVQDIAVLGNDKLVVAESSTFKDAVHEDKLCVDGVRLREMALGADGTPGATLKMSKSTQRQASSAVCANPGVLMLTHHMGWGFLGNRFAGLMMRVTVTAAQAKDSLPPVKKVTSLANNGAGYVGFVYSPAHDVAYTIIGEMLFACPARKKGEAATPVAVRCPNLAGAMAVDDSSDSLFVALKDGSIKRFALSTAGIPSDTNKMVPTGVNPINIIAINPKTKQFYVFGSLQGEQPAGTQGKLVRIPAPGYLADIAVDANRGRLYGMSSYNANANIWVWKLNADGTLSAEKPRTYSDGLKKDNLRTLGANIKVDAKRNRLYSGGTLENSKVGGVVVYKLDANGDPQGDPHLYKTLQTQGNVGSVGLANDGRWLYQSGWGEDTVYAYPLNDAGDPPDDTAKIEKWPVGGNYGKSCFTMTPDGKALLMGTYQTIEAIPLRADGRPVTGLQMSYQFGTQKGSFGALPIGTTSEWVTLDEALKDANGSLMGGVALGGATITNAVVKTEFAYAKNPMLPLLTHTSTLAGPSLAVFLPRYGVDDVSKVPEMIQPSDLRYKQYFTWASQYALKPEERPKELVIANGMIPIDSCVESLRYGMQVLGMMGHTAAQIWAGMPPEMIHKITVESGINHIRDAVYNPQTYFDYVPELMTPESQDKWAKEFTKAADWMGFKPIDMSLFHMADEPGWYFPSQYDEVKKSPAALGVFRDYLKSKGMTLELLGKASWDQVEPMRPSKMKTLGDKRLFFWTTRFYTESLSKAFAAATAAMQRQVNPKILTTTNLNNWPGHYYIPSPGQKIANNGDTGPDAGMGMPDWFDLGRKKGVTAIWTEDWFGDGTAMYWSLYADLLRCAAREGGVEFGGYTVGHATGGMENGGKYKIMALMGHGAKGLDPYTFGPNPGFGDGWSDNGPRVYQSLTSGLRLLGKSEKLIAPGRPRAGTVAVLFSQASQAWDPDAKWYMYIGEYYGLHFGLMHKHYPVDFVDDYDVEDGALQKYGYSTLYADGPNLSVKAQEQIMAWVKAGGTLVLLPGACTADEYNEPTTQMPMFMGAAWDGFKRVPGPTADELRAIKPMAIKVTDNRFGVTEDATMYQAVSLTVNGAKALATFGNGKPAITEMAQGQGRVFAYGFWPGADYNGNTGFAWAPTNEAERARALLTAPAKIAGAKKFVDISVDNVEGALLESDKGIAVTLLNWTKDQAPLPSITVTVASTPKLDAAVKAGKLKVESADTGTVLKYTATDKGVEVTLPLKDVDVLMLSW